MADEDKWQTKKEGGKLKSTDMKKLKKKDKKKSDQKGKSFKDPPDNGLPRDAHVIVRDDVRTASSSVVTT